VKITKEEDSQDSSREEKDPNELFKQT